MTGDDGGAALTGRGAGLVPAREVLLLGGRDVQTALGVSPRPISGAFTPIEGMRIRSGGEWRSAGTDCRAALPVPDWAAEGWGGGWRSVPLRTSQTPEQRATTVTDAMTVLPTRPG